MKHFLSFYLFYYNLRYNILVMKLDETRFLVQTFSQTCTLARAELYLNTAVSNSKQFVQKKNVMYNDCQLHCGVKPNETKKTMPFLKFSEK